MLTNVLRYEWERVSLVLWRYSHSYFSTHVHKQEGISICDPFVTYCSLMRNSSSQFLRSGDTKRQGFPIWGPWTPWAATWYFLGGHGRIWKLWRRIKLNFISPAVPTYDYILTYQWIGIESEKMNHWTGPWRLLNIGRGPQGEKIMNHWIKALS